MTESATILIVDDNAANRDMLRQLLEAEKHQVIEAADGLTALQIAAENPPDLVLLDVMMPGMDGIEVCRRLRAHPQLADVHIIMVTALDERELRLAGLEAGADDIITKPFNRAELRARVRTVTRLNRSRRLREMQGELHEKEKYLRVLFELGPVAIYSCDSTGAIQSFNRHAAALWGREPMIGDFLDRCWGAYELYLPDGSSAPSERCAMTDVLSGRVSSIERVEVVVERRDGSRINALVSIVPLKNSRGEITSAINSFHDLTECTVAETALL